jgi:putative Holliday junction resolvase
MAIDIGGKRTGLAVGSDETGIVSPVGVIETAGADERTRQLGKAIDEHDPSALIVGLPLNMDGSEGPPAKAMREQGERWGRQFDLPVHFVDERLTSFAADQQMNQSGLTHGGKKARRDALAAAAILRDFLEGLKRDSSDA